MRPALALALFLATSALAAPGPRNIILIIGDGVGPAHLTVAKNLRGEAFHIGRMKTIGICSTSSADRAVPDSAASATALATGFKTNNEWVSVDPAGAPLQTVLEVAEKKGMRTGLITTTVPWDATPAAFAAHAKDRREFSAIGSQMLRSGADIIAGAGLVSTSRPPLRELREIAVREGYSIVTTRAGLEAAGSGKVLALFPEQPRDVDFPEVPLPVLAKWSIDRLSGAPKGFFLLIEHEGTDSASHQNNTADVNASLVSLDLAVGAALDFAETRADTLVIVTSDHETGGLRIGESWRSGRSRLEWSSPDHTGISVLVHAHGPGSEHFTGFYDNTDIGKRLMEMVRVGGAEIRNQKSGNQKLDKPETRNQNAGSLSKAVASDVMTSDFWFLISGF